MTFNRPQGDNSDVNIGINIVTNKQALAASKSDIKALTAQLEAAFDPTAIAAQTAAFRKQQGELANTRAETAKNRDITVQWRAALKDIERTRAINELTSELAKAQIKGKDVEKTLASVEARLRSIGATDVEVANVLGGAAQQAGGRRGAGLARFGVELRNLPALQTPLGVSTDVFGKIIASIGRLGVSAGQLAIAAPVAALTVGALAVAVKNFNEDIGPIIERFNQVRAARQEVAGLLAGGNAEDIVSARERALAEVTRLEAERNQAIEDAASSLGGARGQGALGQLLVGLSNIDLGPLGTINAGPLGGVVTNIDALENKLNSAQTTLDELNKVYEENIAKIEAEKAAKEEQAQLDQHATTILQAKLAAQKLDADAITERINTLDAERRLTEEALQTQGLSEQAAERLQSRLRDIADEMDVFNAALPDAQRLASIQEALEDQEEAREQLTALSQKALDIEQRGQERINNIREQGLKQIEAGEERLADARTKLVDFNTETAEKANEINRKFMADDLKALDDFIIRERRIKRDQRTELLRLAQDEKDALLEAEEANDVAAFIQARRNFERQRREQREDNETEAGDRAEDLQRERDAIAANRNERLAALQVEADKKRADLQAEIAEREIALQQIKDQIAERVQAEEDAIKQSLGELVKTFDDSTAHMEQTVKDGFAAFEAAGITSFNAVVDNMIRQSNLAIQSIQTQRTFALPPPLPTSGFGGSGGGIAFARGGLPTQRNLPALLNDRPGYLDAVIPYRQSEGIERAIAKLGLGGNQGPVLNAADMFRGATIGSGVTQTDLDALGNTMTHAYVMAMNALRIGQAPGSA